MTNLYSYKNFMTYKIINYKGILNLICENICLSFLNAMSIKFEGGGGGELELGPGCTLRGMWQGEACDTRCMGTICSCLAWPSQL